MRRGVRPRHCLDVEDADDAAVNAEGSGTLRRWRHPGGEGSGTRRRPRGGTLSS